MKFTVTSVGLMTLAVLNCVFIQLASCQDSFSCRGSSLCSGPLLTQGNCDNAMRKIIPTKRYFVGGPGGTCDFHCGLFVSGANLCDLTGDEMLVAYRELRNNGCAKCGMMTYNDGCQFKIDYVTICTA